MVGGPDGVEHFDRYPIAEVTEDEIQGVLPSSRTVNVLLKIMGGTHFFQVLTSKRCFELPSHDSLCTLKSPATKRLEPWLRTSSRWVSRYSRRAVSWLGVERCSLKNVFKSQVVKNVFGRRSCA